MSSACSSTSETSVIIRQGGDHLSMARGGIYTADLAAKESGIKISGAKNKSHQKLWRAAAVRKHDPLKDAVQTSVCLLLLLLLVKTAKLVFAHSHKLDN